MLVRASSIRLLMVAAVSVDCVVVSMVVPF
jgi:hypothetical protein